MVAKKFSHNIEHPAVSGTSFISPFLLYLHYITLVNPVKNLNTLQTLRF